MRARGGGGATPRGAALAALLLFLFLATVPAAGCGLPRAAEGGPVVRPLPVRPLQPAPLAPFAERLDVARDGSTLWVTSSGEVYVQEGSGSRATPRLLARGWRSAFWYRGGLGVVGVRGQRRRFAVIYRLPGGREEPLGTTDAPAQVEVTPAGWLAWPLAGTLEMADPLTESRTRVPGLLRGASGFRLAPDGSQVAVARAGRLERVALEGTGSAGAPPGEVLGPLAAPAALDWSGDGRWLAWAAPAGGGAGRFAIRLYDGRRGRVRTLWTAPATGGRGGAPGTGRVVALHWLPGRPLLLVEVAQAGTAGERRYLLVDLKGATQLLPFAGGEAWPLPDGSGFLFVGPPRAPSAPERGQPAVWAVRLPEPR
ncbi:MAG: hypothetical protein QJR08_02680 [Bacillota bacterium]|nr:hypothetical protein [Bacillota bacterium]